MVYIVCTSWRGTSVRIKIREKIMSMKVNKVLPSPAELKEEYPLSEKLIQLKKERDAEIRDILPENQINSQ